MSGLTRSYHKLESTKRKSLPKRILVFDTETNQTKLETADSGIAHTLKFGCFKYIDSEMGSYSRAYHGTFTSDTEFWQTIKHFSNPRKTLWVFAHNLSWEGTMICLWDRAELEDIEITNYILEDPPNIVNVKINGRRVKFVDTMNYWPVSLKKIGEDVGLHQLDCPNDGADPDTWHLRCFRNVDIILRAVAGLYDFVSDNNYGSFAATAASVSWNAFRAGFLPENLFIHDNKGATHIERKSYYGGRADCFFIGKVEEPIYILDVNSLYPFIMFSQKMPCKLIEYSDCSSLEMFRGHTTEIGYVAHVHVDSEFDVYPIETNNGTLYCRGKFPTFLCGAELDMALIGECVTAVYSHAKYEMAFLFDSFVDHFYSKRLQFKENGDLLNSYLCKLIMNSLYGKFAQRGFRWIKSNRVDVTEPYGEWAERNDDNNGWSKFRSVSWVVQKQLREDEWLHSLPAIPAFITAAARQYMKYLITIAGRRNVFYMDTDSLHVNFSGYGKLCKANLVDDNKLGYLKEVKVVQSAEYRNVRDYTADDINVIAGVQKGLKEKEDGQWIQETNQGIRTILTRPPRGQVIVRERKYTRRKEYSRGGVGSDGWTYPFVLDR